MEEQRSRTNRDGGFPGTDTINGVDDTPRPFHGCRPSALCTGLLSDLHRHHTLRVSVQQHRATKRNCGHPAQEPGGHNTTDDALHRRSGVLVAAAVGQANQTSQETRDATRCRNGGASTDCLDTDEEFIS